MPLVSNPDRPENRPVPAIDRDKAPPDGRSALTEAETVRADTYVLLARLFRAPPDQALLDRLMACRVGDEQDAPLAKAWAGLADASRQADPRSLDDEFHALFIGLGRGELLPYASWYLSGFLLDKPLAQLRADLKKLGIERVEDVSESEDHVAALCETMALLVDADAGIDHAGQKKFFDRHFHPWVPRFFADLRTAKHSDFYRRVADLGQQFIEFEQSWLSLPQ